MKPKKYMENRYPKVPYPELPNVDEKPLDLNAIKKKCYPEY